MRKLLPLIIIAIIVLVFASCSIQYKQRCIDIPGQGCRPINAGNVGGTTIGHINEDTVEKDNR